MAWRMRWLNKSIVTINVILELLNIYIYRYAVASNRESLIDSQHDTHGYSLSSE